jgi:[ribosomal protein S18]-alanine N-acetyltransferase
MSSLTFLPMTVYDLPDVLRMERASFVSPWSESMFLRDILHNTLAHIYSVRREMAIIGYYSLWKIVDEGHLVTICVDPSIRRQGVGSEILEHALRLGESLNLRNVTLEVRDSNRDAIRLYTRFGFMSTGVRMKYYEDGTHARIMDIKLGAGRGARA